MNMDITEQQSPRRWAGVAAAAKHAAVGLTTFWTWINEGHVIAKRVGARKIVVDICSVDRFIEGCPSVAPPSLFAADLGMHGDAPAGAARQEGAFPDINTSCLSAALEGQP